MVREWIADNKVTGLGVLRLPSGVETWYLRYREPSGKQQHHKIGRVDVLNRTLAREEALKILAATAQGQAPTSARQELRRGPTMADLHQRLLAEHYPKLRPRTLQGYRSIWDAHLIPKLGRYKVQAVTSADVMRLLAGIRPVQANRTLAVLRKAFNLAILWGMRPDNPCEKVPGNSERKRRRYLSGEERQCLVTALDAIATSPVRWRFAQLVRLLMLTGCRVGEICRGRWEWVDEKAGVMIVPPDSHKTGQKVGHERVVHIPPAGILILKELRLRSNTPWIIAGEGDGHLVGYQKLWEELMRIAGISNLKVHDLRHHWASVAITKVGLTLPQVGSLLGHASPVTTSRYAHLLEDGAQAMARAVADHLDVSSYQGDGL
jgi:integrase